MWINILAPSLTPTPRHLIQLLLLHPACGRDVSVVRPTLFGGLCDEAAGVPARTRGGRAVKTFTPPFYPTLRIYSINGACFYVIEDRCESTQDLDGYFLSLIFEHGEANVFNLLGVKDSDGLLEGRKDYCDVIPHLQSDTLTLTDTVT